MRTIRFSAVVACGLLLSTTPALAQSSGSATGTARGSGTATSAGSGTVITSSGAIYGTRQPARAHPGATGSASGWAVGSGHRPGWIGHGGVRQTPLGIIVGSGTTPVYPHYSQYRASDVYLYTTPAAPLPGAAVTPYAPHAAAPRFESCAIVNVLQPGNRGFWKALRLPAAGAQNTEELQRILDARIDEGAAFRIRDAAGEWLEIPAPTQLERIVVERCR